MATTIINTPIFGNYQTHGEVKEMRERREMKKVEEVEETDANLLKEANIQKQEKRNNDNNNNNNNNNENTRPSNAKPPNAIAIAPSNNNTPSTTPLDNMNMKMKFEELLSFTSRCPNMSDELKIALFQIAFPQTQTNETSKILASTPKLSSPSLPTKTTTTTTTTTTSPQPTSTSIFTRVNTSKSTSISPSIFCSPSSSISNSPSISNSTKESKYLTLEDEKIDTETRQRMEQSLNNPNVFGRKSQNPQKEEKEEKERNQDSLLLEQVAPDEMLLPDEEMKPNTITPVTSVNLEVKAIPTIQTTTTPKIEKKATLSPSSLIRAVHAIEYNENGFTCRVDLKTEISINLLTVSNESNYEEEEDFEIKFSEKSDKSDKCYLSIMLTKKCFPNISVQRKKDHLSVCYTRKQQEEGKQEKKQEEKKQEEKQQEKQQK